MASCLILGGCGYIGYRWAKRLAEKKRFDRIVLADIRTPPEALAAEMEYVQCDVRQPIDISGLSPEWICNFAAVHREPGHRREEYFDTNLPGATNVCEFATQTGCKKILFTSSIAVYGTLDKPKSEASIPYPNSAYGISKLCAELIHQSWRKSESDHILRVCRPGVIYGPGDPGNMLRMIRAIRKGYFFFPGSKRLRKSYGYIEGLLDSFEFVMSRPESQLTYNYVERDTETLGVIVDKVKKQIGSKVPVFTAPLVVLETLAAAAQIATAGRSPIHPVRVRKTASSTHILSDWLVQMGFNFRYDFATSLSDWANKSPEDFA